MKILLHLLPLLALIIAPLRADDSAIITAVRAADDARVAATIAADRAGLDAVFSDGLRYAHSSGAIDTKASFMAAILGGRTKYVSIDYDDRDFTVAAPGIVLMTGHARFKAGRADSPENLYLGFLAVWREEKGAWRFLAWQSCRVRPPAPPKT
ncbi:MAG: DUF4440 domain-containing protein [Verrucomicrobia bacterium RIFCSPLOWO2_12_FULL_64_8]|nr:MAG: DUF4440 domain-containing protein [Verrucomicrobia bacterium RIFCSPLOWO2_12_FULL_64_8]